jgi:AcrR family transcriptional regulator
MKPKDPAKAAQIRAATLKLVAAKGLSSLTMAEIGKEAGVGMGTLYVYFASKEEIILTLYKELKAANTARIYAKLEPDLSFQENLKKLYEGYLYNRLLHFDEHFFIDQCTNLPFLDEEARQLEVNAFAGIFQLLDVGKAHGDVQELDNAILTAHLIGAANELVNLLRANKQALSSAFISQAFQLGWSGIKKP